MKLPDRLEEVRALLARYNPATVTVSGEDFTILTWKVTPELQGVDRNGPFVWLGGAIVRPSHVNYGHLDLTGAVPVFREDEPSGDEGKA